MNFPLVLAIVCESQIRVTINGSFYMVSLKLDCPGTMNCTVPQADDISYVQTEEQITETVTWNGAQEEYDQVTTEHVSFHSLMMYQIQQTLNKSLYTSGLIIKKNLSVCAVGEDPPECNKFCNVACSGPAASPGNYTYIMTSTGDININKSGSLPMPPYFCPNGSEKNVPNKGVFTASNGTVNCNAGVKWHEYKLKGKATVNLTCPNAVDCTYVKYAQFQDYTDIVADSMGDRVKQLVLLAENEEEGVVQIANFSICAAGNTQAECQRYCKKYCVYQDPTKVAKYKLTYNYNTTISGAKATQKYLSQELPMPSWYCPKGYVRDPHKPTPVGVWIFVAVLCVTIVVVSITTPILCYRQARHLSLCFCTENKKQNAIDGKRKLTGQNKDKDKMEMEKKIEQEKKNAAKKELDEKQKLEAEKKQKEKQQEEAKKEAEKKAKLAIEAQKAAEKARKAEKK